MRSEGVVLIALVLALAGCGDQPPAAVGPGPVQVSAVLGDAAEAGYERALAPRPFAFPADHGAHPSFRSEWWYWTGNLTTADGRAFGFQFTVFRSALAPPPSEGLALRPSAWAAREAWLAHFTVSDVAGRRFTAGERAARGALGLGGALPMEPVAGEPGALRVVCDGWQALLPGTAGGTFRLQAADRDHAIDLELDPGKPAVLQGDRGLSRKGAGDGNASFYYSLTRMPTHGTLTVGGTAYTVTGSSWMDREWSTSALEAGVQGWDWFALQLADGRDLMFYRLRRADGTATPFSAGTLVAADGSSSALTADEVTVTTTATWTSRTGVTYPAAWRLRVRDLDLTITPRLPDQELDLTVRYWEGAVTVGGSTTGVGYVELAGYR